MRHEIEVSEFSAVIQEFAAYKSAIQGCSQRTVEEYLLDLRTFFRYLLCREDAEVLNDPERFATVSVLPVDLEYLRTVTADQIYAFLIYADKSRNPGCSFDLVLDLCRQLLHLFRRLHITVKKDYIPIWKFA